MPKEATQAPEKAKRKVSCLPCRLKKVKCDGNSPCVRCVRRNAKEDCVFAKPAPLGRPPKNAVVNKLILTRRNVKEAEGSQLINDFIFERITSNASTNQSRFLLNNKTVGLVCYLNDIFNAYFGDSVPAGIKGSESHDSSVRKLAQRTTLYDLLPYFTWMTGDVVNITVKRFSQLEIQSYEVPDFTPQSLRMDRSKEFFCSVPKGVVINPLNTMPQEKARQLIDCFFSVHPYSHLFSKTIILQSYWTDTADPLLLCVIYGTTLYFSRLLEGKPFVLNTYGVSASTTNVYLDYANFLLQKSSGETSASRYQALAVLALFESTFGSVKRGMTLFTLAHMMAVRMGLFSDGARNLAEVERESLFSTFWANFNVTLRGSMELDQMPREAITRMVQAFPPCSLETSAVYQFDMSNDNVRLFRSYAYHVESFYTESVLSHFSAKIVAFLPEPKHNFFRIRLKKDSSSKRSSLIRRPANAETGIKNVMREFEIFIQDNRDSWNPQQLYMIETTWLLFSIHFTFLKPSITQSNDAQDIENTLDAIKRFDESRASVIPDQDQNWRESSRPKTYLFFDGNQTLPLELSDLDVILRMHQVLPLAVNLMERLQSFLANPENYCNQVDWLPHCLMASSIETSARILMIKYFHDPWDIASYRHIQTLYTLVQDKVWTKWCAISMVEDLLRDFLARYPDPPIGSEGTGESDVFPLLDATVFPDCFNNNGNNSGSGSGSGSGSLIETGEWPSQSQELNFQFQDPVSQITVQPDAFAPFPVIPEEPKLLGQSAAHPSEEQVMPVWVDHSTPSDPPKTTLLGQQAPLSIQQILEFDDTLFAPTSDSNINV